MAITTYQELQDAVANWLARSDLSARVPEFVTMAEGWIAYGLDMPPLRVNPLRVRAMEQTTSTAMVAGSANVALPTRYVSMRNIAILTDPVVKLEPVSPEQRIFERPSPSVQGTPKFFSIEGNNIVLAPIANSGDTISILYYERFASFTTASDTNWLLQNAPNTYLFGALYASTLMTRNPNGPAWLAQFMGSINSLNEADKSDRYSGGVLQMRSATGNP